MGVYGAARGFWVFAQDCVMDGLHMGDAWTIAVFGREGKGAQAANSAVKTLHNFPCDGVAGLKKDDFIEFGASLHQFGPCGVIHR